MFKNLLGIFNRVQELHDDPLLIRGSETELDEFVSKWREARKRTRERGLYYANPIRDLENRRKDKENMARDFNKAFQAAKVRLGV